MGIVYSAKPDVEAIHRLVRKVFAMHGNPDARKQRYLADASVARKAEVPLKVFQMGWEQGYIAACEHVIDGTTDIAMLVLDETTTD